MIDLAEIKSRINPAYQEVRGTESHERKMLCDEIERLREQIATQKAYYESVFEDGARRIAKLTEQRTCNWQHDPEGYWAGDCGIAFCIENETPELNDMHFCPKCGGKLEVKE
jgi:hypothetical protein